MSKMTHHVLFKEKQLWNMKLALDITQYKKANKQAYASEKMNVNVCDWGGGRKFAFDSNRAEWKYLVASSFSELWRELYLSLINCGLARAFSGLHPEKKREQSGIGQET